MGLYASWPLMALTHHLILLYGCYLEGIDPKGRYYLLGDDLIIVGTDVYNAYKKVLDLAQMLVNEQKTFSSPWFVEFAKRYFLHGVDITPLPVGAYLSSKGSVNGIVVATDNAIAKSCLPSLETCQYARKGLFNELVCILSKRKVRESDQQGKAKRPYYGGKISTARVIDYTLALIDISKSVRNPEHAANLGKQVYS